MGTFSGDISGAGSIHLCAQAPVSISYEEEEAMRDSRGSSLGNGFVWMSDRERIGRNEGTPTTGLAVKPKPKAKKPSMFKVIMLNDDYTPMEFVVMVLERFFAKSHEEATRIMLHVHQKGVGVCGVYTYEVAETKVTQVMDLARQHQHPLQCTLERA
jgi:ATP-dependent Clp protease adaptor protein ClpS